MSSIAQAGRPSLVWFRTDLRVHDNRALRAAFETGAPVIAVFILDETGARGRPLGGASRWWLHHSLTALERDLAALNVPLWIAEGETESQLLNIVAVAAAQRVDWTRSVDPATHASDARLKEVLKEKGLAVQSHNGHTLTEPWAVKSKTAGPFKVFTPYSKAARAFIGMYEPWIPLPRSQVIPDVLRNLSIDDLGLLPTIPDWSKGLAETFEPGSAGAEQSLKRFMASAIKGYADRRNLPYAVSTSRLSPHLRWGEISPLRVWSMVSNLQHADMGLERDVFVFQQELLWRDFSYHLLWQNPRLATENWKTQFDGMPWREDARDKTAWQKGKTGYPIVDAGMRELWTTGWMHNRVRMIVASFLTKHLLLDWRVGETWFWDTLVDACPANNPAGWQWTAGSGADAAPYFRLFNPTSQGENFDPQGAYVRKWIPELAKLPASAIHKPWETDPHILRSCGVTLGVNYPIPIVGHSLGRKRALEAFASIQKSGDEG
jgi:deoxyribodipyrimidine photo-lyase